ncbi:MAG: nucleotidyltransferase family protein [Planctomycetes bacterium]|nr:nucleotidyltransferase family protein [Planctomycetota bacterium]MCW8136513.1 nucleotidyltransferase family protein [Planctomycetota bacterium]
MLRDRIHELRDEIQALASKHGAVRIRLFGSVARGEDGPEIDVDFLVQLDTDRSLLDFVNLKLDLEELLGRRVDLVAEGGISKWIRKRVLREAQPI